MKLKSLGIAAIGLAIAGSALADQSNSIYFHVNAGYAYHPWEKLIGPVSTDSNDYNWSNGNSGTTYGLDLGYQFNQNLAVETGYFALPNATLNTSADVVSADALSTTFKTNVFYVALRGLLPISQCFSATAKVGVGSQMMSGNRDTFNNEDGWQESNETNVMFGAGLDYTMMNNFDVNLQYLYFKGDTNNTDYTVGPTQILPDAQLVTLGIGYSFSV